MDRKKAIALSFSVPVAWGFSYPLMKIGMDSMNATSIVALRCIIAFVVCLLLFHKHALRINRDLMVRAAIIGAIMATELTCMCLGSSLTSASTAGFLQSLTVVIVPFANATLLRRAPERKVLIGTAIVTCGMLLLSGADFTIERGQKIALVGRNGEGKTTLARMLIGQLTPTEGSVRLGANVNIGYYAQNQDDLMDGDFTVYDTLDRVAVGDIRTRLRDILGAFLFRGEDIDKKVKVLSGGERARLAMARMMLEPRNLLVLDEPTNHMDMRSKDILKNAIMKYDGTVVVVSHDREFLDGMVEKVYEFRDGGVKEYLGGIYYFLEKRKLESLQEIERRDAPAKTPAKGDEPKPAVSGKLSYEQRKEQEKQLRKAKKVVETIEAELADIEKQIAEYDARFAAATEYNEADYKAYNELKTRYDHQMHEWEKASYELEIVAD